MAERIAIRLLGEGDVALVRVGAELFDDAPLPEQTRAFLASDTHLLWFALADETPVGFVSASILLHPDKPPHIFVNELATHEKWRRKGIATALMQAVLEFGRDRDLSPVWLAAEGDDEVAQAFYRTLSGMTERGAIVFEWE